MTREEKTMKARKLRAEGLTYYEIGKRLGSEARSRQSVESYGYKLAHPDKAREYNRRCEARPGRREAKRACDEAHRATCPRCGGRMGMGSQWASRASEHCVACRIKLRDERWEQVAALWREGLRTDAIASRLGRTVFAIRNDLSRMRKEGYDLPYGYDWRERRAA